MVKTFSMFQCDDIPDTDDLTLPSSHISNKLNGVRAGRATTKHSAAPSVASVIGIQACDSNLLPFARF